MAIALEARGAYNAGGGSEATEHTFAGDTGTGDNRLLYLGFWNVDTGTVPTITYGGQSMTKIIEFTADSSRKGALYYLIDPPTGSNNFVVTFPDAQEAQISWGCITGAKQTGQPDSSNNNNAATGTSFSISTTIVEDGSWLFMHCRNTVGGATEGSGTDLLIDVSGNTGTASSSIASFYSAGPVDAGSRSLNVSVGSSATWGGAIVSFAPATEDPTDNAIFFGTVF